jgi:quercetin dioxygenase-like cupin family protein
MLSRRGFATCAICSAVGLVASEGTAQTSGPGIKRNLLSKTELPGDRYEAILMTVDIPAGGLVPRHTHPGIESAYVIEGGGELSMKDQPNRILKAGEAFQVPPVVPHAWKNGGQPTRLAITYAVEKGKPLASPAPE